MRRVAELAHLTAEGPLERSAKSATPVTMVFRHRFGVVGAGSVSSFTMISLICFVQAPFWAPTGDK